MRSERLLKFHKESKINMQEMEKIPRKKLNDYTSKKLEILVD